MGSIGLPELLIIFGILILLFGARKLPEIGRGLGEGIRSFKTAFSGEDKKEEEKVITSKPKEIEAEVIKKEQVEKAKENA